MLDILPPSQWYPGLALPLIVAGPCSAESERQLCETATQLASTERVNVFRAGIWKPRTRPGSFEGMGEPALKWLEKVKAETGLLVATEVITPTHVSMALDHGIDMVWLGARTTPNPFFVDQLAAQLARAGIPVLVKNPVNPDLDLWIGAMERLNRAGVRKIAAVHRGFYPYVQSNLRNIPKWELAIDLKSRLPNLPILCDPSHIAGNASLVADIAQYALKISFDGLMVEVHSSPAQALSDPKQQLSPQMFGAMMSSLTFPAQTSANKAYMGFIEQTRIRIDSIDAQILELLSNRMRLVEQIGQYKRNNNVTVVQRERWEEVYRSRTELGKSLGLSEEYVKRLLELVHKESIKRQADIV